MKEKWKGLEDIFKKQVLYRIGTGTLFILCSIWIMLLYKNIYFMLPSFITAVFLWLNGCWLFREVNLKRYVVVEGKCSKIERVPISKHVKSIYLETEGEVVKVIMRNQRKTPEVGAQIRVYVHECSPVYDQEEYKLICTYLALETEN